MLPSRAAPIDASEDDFGEAEFEWVDEKQYPDGTVLLERAEVTLPRTYARRQVLLIAKFRRCNAWVSAPEKVSGNGHVRFALHWRVPMDYSVPDTRLRLALYARPRFFGSVKLLATCELDAFDDVVRVRDEQTPGVPRHLTLVGRRGAAPLPAGASLALDVLFFGADADEQRALDAFVDEQRRRNRLSSGAALPLVRAPEGPADAAAPAPPDVDAAAADAAAADAAAAAAADVAESSAAIDTAPVTCALCDASVGREAALVLDCEHSFCQECLGKHVDAALDAGELEVQCPCRSAEQPCVVGQWALREVLPSARFDAYLDRTLQAVLADSNGNGQFFQCANPECGAIMERLQSDADADDDDDADDADDDNAKRKSDADDNEALNHSIGENDAAAERHREKERFRCRACRTVFCAACRAVPYHNGFTCEAFERFKKSEKCRFCDEPLRQAPDPETPEALRKVCDTDECQAKALASCESMLACGHPCCGIRAESEHMPCLKCPDANGDVPGSEWCALCYVDELGAAPSIELKCGHIFHHQCVRDRLRSRWNGPVITFQYLDCPLCAKELSHPALKRELKPALKFKASVEAKANQRLQFEGLAQHDDIVKNKASRFFKEPLKFAMARYAYYQCSRCKHAYFAGQKSCQEADAPPLDPEEQVCGSCSGAALGSALKRCQHGDEFIEYKCWFCCSTASFFCWGKTHFCAPCHQKQRSGDYLSRKPMSAFTPCDGKNGRCPLGIEHPPNGSKVSICLGCAICRQEAAF